MAVKEVFFLMVLIGLSACVLADKCPSGDAIPDCDCYHAARGTVGIQCNGYDTEYTIEDYREILQKHFTEKEKMKFKFHHYNISRIPSRVFQGFNIKALEFHSCTVTRWADEEGGPAFVGLEDTLEKILFWDAIQVKEKNGQTATTPMSLGHLRKLKEVKFFANSLLKIGNDWFGEGGNSVDNLDFNLNEIYEIGDKAFAGMVHLRKLHLHGNKISTMTRSMLPNPANYLEEMHLQNNQITFFSEDMFTNMPELEIIYLSNNKLTKLPETTWRPIWSTLRTLHLHYNDFNCDGNIDWILEIEQPHHLDGGRCISPEERRGKSIRRLIDEKQGISRV